MRTLRQDGLTLIEVVAAIAILGTILVGMVLAKSRHTHQLALAERRSEAATAADELLSRWWANGRNVPAEAEGEMPTDAKLKWTTRVMDNSAIDELEARVVRLEVRDAGAGAANAPSLVVVDMVLPLPDERKTAEVLR